LTDFLSDTHVTHVTLERCVASSTDMSRRALNTLLVHLAWYRL